MNKYKNNNCGKPNYDFETMIMSIGNTHSYITNVLDYISEFININRDSTVEDAIRNCIANAKTVEETRMLTSTLNMIKHMYHQNIKAQKEIEEKYVNDNMISTEQLSKMLSEIN